MMDKNLDQTFDFLIVGSGFAGSILSIGLKKLGYNILVVEKESHPRFAIGESSTPIADMVLRTIADDYGIDWLKPFSRYGTWQNSHPEIACGIKRGFSYYFHQPGEPFSQSQHHENELMVAASVSDENSDTNWFRPEFDAFLADKLEEEGVQYLDRTEIVSVERDGNKWSIRLKKADGDYSIQSKFIVDGSGSSVFSETFLGTSTVTDNFKTHSSAIYSHFTNVREWADTLKQVHPADRPYYTDHSALHHIIEEGWIWMLRFNNGVVSSGIMLDGEHGELSDFQSIIGKYPSISKLYEGSELTSMPGNMVQSGRLQRRLTSLYGPGWVALNHTGGFIDPLHSTGIAHSLIGVQRLLKIFESYKPGDKPIYTLLERYDKSFFREISLIDQLVAGCYHLRFDPDLFRAYTMLYFICSISFEQQYLSDSNPDGFLGSDDEDILSLVEEGFEKAMKLHVDSEREEKVQLINWIRESIQPFNTAGLMNPESKNLYRHSAVEL